MSEDVTFDPTKLTGKQAIFLQDKTGRSLAEFAAILSEKNPSARDALAVAALATNPDDPDAAWEELMNQEVTVTFAAFKDFLASTPTDV